MDNASDYGSEEFQVRILASSKYFDTHSSLGKIILWPAPQLRVLARTLENPGSVTSDLINEIVLNLFL